MPTMPTLTLIINFLGVFSYLSLNLSIFTSFKVFNGLRIAISSMSRTAGSSLVIAYTLALLVSGNHFVDFIYGRMYLSTTSARFIASHGDILQSRLAVQKKALKNSNLIENLTHVALCQTKIIHDKVEVMFFFLNKCLYYAAIDSTINLTCSTKPILDTSPNRQGLEYPAEKKKECPGYELNYI